MLFHFNINSSLVSSAFHIAFVTHLIDLCGPGQAIYCTSVYTFSINIPLESYKNLQTIGQAKKKFLDRLIHVDGISGEDTYTLLPIREKMEVPTIKR